MKKPRARRHCAHSTTAWVAAFTALVVGCGAGALPRPLRAQVRAEDYVPVPFAPRPPPVEIVPPRPPGPQALVWADGGWEWDGERFRWLPGAWVAPPADAKRVLWVLVRRPDDGQLFFAPSSWRDASGKAIDPPVPIARAQTRPGGPAEAIPGARTDLDE